MSASRPSAGDPRIHIWGTLEARLQSVDLLILGGLDEGIWPAEARSDAWLSRRMRRDIGLSPPERRIGLAAHDFAQALAQPRVIITRADKRGGAPTVPSRWLQRLATLIGPARMKRLVNDGRHFVRLARQLDQVPQADVKPATRPQPKPPVAARPRELSITSIELLIRDPYAVYARRILQLEPLDPIGQRADLRMRGNLIHDALSEFTKEWLTRSTRRMRPVSSKSGGGTEDRAYPEVHAVVHQSGRVADRS
jgi:ATP-dependent helicase/nuclease subunit B